MNQQTNKTGVSITALLLASFYLSSCGSSSSSVPLTSPVSPPALASYEVTVVNATGNQPFSPVAVIAHSADYSAWRVGSAASPGIENLAEGGSNSQLLASLSGVDAASASGEAAIAPGGNEKISITVSASTQTLITVAGMLVNTNDAFAGLRSIDVSALTSGDSMTVWADVYDAGTELNSESSGTMPGPADGGEGFNAARSDISNVVRRHGGVVTLDDGLSTSVLDQSHRFDNPAMMVTITKL